MSTPLHDIWDAAAETPYHPPVSKGSQPLVGILLLIFAFLLTGVFALNRSAVTLPVLGLPASIAFGFGAVFMICAVGVYV